MLYESTALPTELHRRAYNLARLADCARFFHILDLAASDVHLAPNTILLLEFCYNTVTHMKTPFLEPNDPRVWLPSATIDPATITSNQMQLEIERIRKVCYGHQQDHSKPVLVGIAAPQMGISKRIFAIDLAADGHGKVGDLRIFINPVITQKSEDKQEWYEGCYTTAPICAIVARPRLITLEAYDANGHKIAYELEGFTAREALHELDHLDGHVLLDRVTDPDKLHIVQPEEFPEYRDKEGWRNWPKKCPPGYWNQLRRHGHSTKN